MHVAKYHVYGSKSEGAYTTSTYASRERMGILSSLYTQDLLQHSYTHKRDFYQWNGVWVVFGGELTYESNGEGMVRDGDQTLCVVAGAIAGHW
jgi:hypothetical protein